MNMHASNMAAALGIAIKAQEQTEARMGYHGSSALLQGWRDVLAALERGEEVRIVTAGVATGQPAHSKSEYKRRVALGDPNVAPPAGVKASDAGPNGDHTPMPSTEKNDG